MFKSLLTTLTLAAVIGFACLGSGADMTRTSGCKEPVPAPLAEASEWNTVANSTDPTGRSAIGWIGDYVYIFGTEDDPNLALFWHVPTGTWGRSTRCPVSGYNWTGAVAGGEMYVLGRFDGTHPTREFRKFTPDGTGRGTWTSLSNYPKSVTLLAMGADDANGLIYAAGGMSHPDTVYRDAYVYDIASDSWNPIPSMNAARTAVGGAFLKGMFYVVGGIDSLPPLYTNDLYAYDPDSARWVPDTLPLTPLPYTVAFNWSCVTSDTQYLYQVGGGGGYHTWPARTYVYYYDPEANSWAGLDPLPARHGTNSAVWVGAPDTAFLFSTGGWDGVTWVTSTYKIPLVEDTTGAIPPPSNPPLSQNYPNPFAHTTTSHYSVSGGGRGRTAVALGIYDLTGRLVRSVVNAELEPGSYSAVWNGRDSLGRPVARGVYLMRLQAGHRRSAKTIAVLR